MFCPCIRSHCRDVMKHLVGVACVTSLSMAVYTFWSTRLSFDHLTVCLLLLSF